jgi:hypothetical protein
MKSVLLLLVAATTGAVLTWHVLPAVPLAPDERTTTALSGELNTLTRAVASWKPPSPTKSTAMVVARETSIPTSGGPANQEGALKDTGDASTTHELLGCDTTRTCNATGMQLYHQGDSKDAVRYFVRALDLDPRNVVAAYNAACAHGLLHDASRSVAMLQRLADDSSETARLKLKKVESDHDFDGVRTTPELTAFLAQFR